MKGLIVAALLITTAMSSSADAQRARKSSSANKESFVVRNASKHDVCEVRIVRNRRRVSRLNKKLATGDTRWISYRGKKGASYLVEAISCDGKWSASKRLRGVSGVIDVTFVSHAGQVKQAEPGAAYSTFVRFESTTICPPSRSGKLNTACLQPRRPKLRLKSPVWELESPW